MKFQNVLVDTKDNIAVITINRPSKLNALNKATIKDLHDVLAALGNDKDAKVINLTGSGDKAFVAGTDNAEIAHFSSREGGKLASSGQTLLFTLIENMGTPVIA